MMSVWLDLQTLHPSTKGLRCFDNCVVVLVIFVLLFTVFCIVCVVFLYCFVYVYLFLFVTSVRTTATE